MSEEKSKDWDQPWPPTKIRQQAANWNLAGDAGLLLHLRQASDNLMTRIEISKKNIGDLTDNVQKVAFRLDGTISDFSRLANHQFIENRVYDDDANVNRDQKPVQKTTKTKAELESEMVSCMKCALEKGCAVLDSHFTKIDVQPLDFDEEDDPTFTPQPVYEPKDSYGHRPLPFIIGSTEFMQSDFLGLIEDEEENARNKKQESVSESEDEDTVPVVSSQTEVKYSHMKDDSGIPPSAPSAARPIPIMSPPPPAGKTASDSSSGLFGTSVDSGEVSFPQDSSNAEHVVCAEENGQNQDIQKDDFRSELAKRLVQSVPPVKPATVVSAPPPVIPALNSNLHGTYDGTILPPPLPPARKNISESDDEGGLFSPHCRDLFLDDDEKAKPAPLPRRRVQQMAESDTIATGPASDRRRSAETAKRERSEPVEAKGPSKQSDRASTAPAEDPVVLTKDKESSIFSNEASDDDDLFGNVYKKEPAVITAPRKSPARSQPISNKTISEPGIIAPLVQSSIIAPTSRLAAAKLFDDDDDEDDLFSFTAKGNSRIPKDDIFSGHVPSSTKEKVLSPSSGTGLSKPDSDSLPAGNEQTKPAPVPRSRLKQLDDHDGTVANLTESNQSTNQRDSADNDHSTRIHKHITSESMDEEVHAINASIEPTAHYRDPDRATKAKGPSILFDDGSDDDDLFGKIQKQTLSIPASVRDTGTKDSVKPATGIPQPATTITTIKKTGSLFNGDDDDDDDDLFSAVKSAKPFGSSTANGGIPRTDTAVPKSENLSTKANSLPKKSGGLFDDDDDMDIFQ